MSICSSCHILKDLDQFVKDGRRKSGYSTKCKECINTRRRQLYKEKKNQNCINAKKCIVSYEIKNPEHVEEIGKLLQELENPQPVKKEKWITMKPEYNGDKGDDMKQYGFWYPARKVIELDDEDGTEYEIENRGGIFILAHLRNRPHEYRELNLDDKRLEIYKIPIRGFSGQVSDGKIFIDEIRVQSGDLNKNF